MKTEYAVGNIHVHFESRARRRWLVALIYACFAALIVAWFSNYAHVLAAWCLIVAVALQLLIVSIAGRSQEASDEREQHRRDRAHYLAWRPLGWVLVGALFAAGVSNSFSAIASALPADIRGIFDQLPYAILMAAGVLYLTLPQTILLWTEPDMN